MDIKKVAELARMNLKPEEEKRFQKDLDAILEYVNKLKSLATDDVEPTSHVLDLENVFRPDEVKATPVRDQVLEHAPLTEAHFFKVPKVVDKE